MIVHPLLTPEQVAERLNTTTRHVYQIIKEGKLKSYYRLGHKMIRVSEEQLADYVDKGLVNESR